jgi:P-loop containing dynein motor region D4
VFNTGEICGLFKPEELDLLLNPLKEAAANEGWRGSVYPYFLRRVKANLHVVLILDSARVDFAQKCESNPAFLSDCTFLWMERWQNDSMLEVPKLLLGAVLGKLPEASSIYNHARTIHSICLTRGATPRHLRSMLETCLSVYQRFVLTRCLI